MTDNFMLYLIKHYFKLDLYLVINFGILCFAVQGAIPISVRAETVNTPAYYESTVTAEAAFEATEDNTAIAEINVSGTSKPMPATTPIVRVFNIDVRDRTDETAISTTQAVTSISELTDVQPTDWAFQALLSLATRYGVITGYPDSAYRGDRAITRYEFAAGISAVLKRVNELITTGVSDQIARDDLIMLQRLQKEFAAELATLQARRVDTLEANAASLEANQFSTTTKLTGQVIFALTGGGFSGDRIIAPTGVEIANEDPNSTFIYRASLNFNTSFRGTDLLQIRLTTGSAGSDDNVAGLLEPNFGSVLDFSVPGRNDRFGIGRLYYTFTPVKDLTLTLGSALLATDYVDLNTYANDSAQDFSTQALINNFVLLPTPAGAGAVIEWNPKGGSFTLRTVYVAGNANDASGGDNTESPGFIGGTSAPQLIFPTNEDEGGLFGSPYQGLVEAEYSVDNVFALRLQYSRGAIFGSRFNAIGANFELPLSQQIAFFGRYGYGMYDDSSVGDLRPHYWMAGISFRDLFVTGAIAGIAASQPLIESTVGNATQTNIEAFYNYPFNDNIKITPLIQVITSPGNQGSNGTIITGTLRTVFSF